MSPPAPQTAEYRCPGEGYPITRAVHLGRLARFYPGCRQCPHRDDTGTLSPRQVRLLVETRPRGQRPPLFHEEGAGGVSQRDLGPTVARDLAAAMGIWLQRLVGGTGILPVQEPSTGETPVPLPAAGNEPSLVAIAGNGRPPSADLVAAVSEGLRWSGCHVLDIGPATAPCLAFAIDHLTASGGILVGNSGHDPQYVGLKFWDHRSRPLSTGGPLESLREVYETGTDRPTRTYGALQRFQAEVPYLAGLAPRYHALRPLRLALNAACGPLVGYLRKLTAESACQLIPCQTTGDALAAQVREAKAHFAAQIDGDGETCRLLDEQGRPVSVERLLLLLARHLLAEHPHGAVVLAHDLPPAVARAIEGQKGVACLLPERPTTNLRSVPGFAQKTPDPFLLCGRVFFSDACRFAMAEAMQKYGALLGGGSDGRCWYAALGPPLPDALMTLTLLLGILSQSDRPLSEVLNHESERDTWR